MKIALPTSGNAVNDHFGHCDHYTIYTVEGNTITAADTLPSPGGCGCKSDIAYTMQEMGVTVMLAGNMGDGALNKLNGCGINVIRGCSGEVEEVVKAYLAGEIKDSGTSCHCHEGEGHSCPNNQ